MYLIIKYNTYFPYYRYKANIRHALENPLTVMSLIMDGMDQSHSRCPHLGSQSTFSKPLKQHIQGVLVHGVGMK